MIRPGEIDLADFEEVVEDFFEVPLSLLGTNDPGHQSGSPITVPSAAADLR